MKQFFLSKIGMVCLCLVTLLMAFMLHRVTVRAKAREQERGEQTGPESAGRRGNSTPAEARSGKGSASTGLTGKTLQKGETQPVATETVGAKPKKEIGTSHSGDGLQENMSYLDQSRNLSGQSKKDRDRQGRAQIRRKTAGGVGEAQDAGEGNVATKKKQNLKLRLDGRATRITKAGKEAEERPAERQEMGRDAAGEKAGTGETSEEVLANYERQVGESVRSGILDTNTTEAAGDVAGKSAMVKLTGAVAQKGVGGDEDWECFCPYGRPIRCELVFTIDSCMEETPLVALVMEPVYNNGQLVIPAGAELHGMARPDRLRDRIFSANEWVLLLPREGSLANGRELRVRGLALDRAEPAADGLSWGITDGSNGLQGQIIRTLENEEIKRFAASFISASALGLQEREASGRNGARFTNSPTNAALQGVAATLEDTARKIGAEIERHGVFLRVPGGKQFYFYPQQAIHPHLALVPAPAGTQRR